MTVSELQPDSRFIAHDKLQKVAGSSKGFSIFDAYMATSFGNEASELEKDKDKLTTQFEERTVEWESMSVLKREEFRSKVYEELRLDDEPNDDERSPEDQWQLRQEAKAENLKKRKQKSQR